MKSAELKKILLVEDDPDDIELTLSAFQKSDFSNDVTVVRDGEEALDYLGCSGQYYNRIPGNPVVVLLDLKLPKIDGLQVLRQMRLDYKLSLIPVIALTSSREEMDLVQNYNIGTNSFIIKPVRLQDFIQAVKEIDVYELLITKSSKV